MFYLVSTVLCTKSVESLPVGILEYCHAWGGMISLYLSSVGIVTGYTVLDRHCGSRQHNLTSPVGNVSACSVKGRHYTSKSSSFLTLPGFWLECSYAFNNAFLSQGNLAQLVLLRPGFSILDIYSRAELSCCWVTQWNSHCCYSITLFSPQDVKGEMGIILEL